MPGPRSPLRGLVLLVAAVAAFTVAALLIASRFEGGRPRNIVLVVACVAAGAALLVRGVHELRRRDGERAPGAPDYRHMARPVVVTVLVMAAMGLVLDALVPASYGLIGPYRADALTRAAEREPHHLGEAACADCHEKQVKLHDKDAHARVPCESCHGPGQEHVAFRKTDAGKVADLPESAIPAAAKMLVRKERDWCLRCHQADPARPGAFPQIVWSEHMRVSGVVEPGKPGEPAATPTDDNATATPTATLACGRCHDPHEPLYMDRDLRTARLHPLVHRCEDCHGRVDSAFVEAGTPDKHPVTFQCSYCHKTVADEFTRSPHKSLECTTCHVFFKESSFAGRIIRDADPRFCLLCHQRTDFRRADGPKTIKWPSHREAMKKDEQDKRQNCIECHHSAMHYPPPPKVEVDVDSLFDDEPAKPDDKAPDAKPEAKPDDKAPDAKPEAKPDDKAPDAKPEAPPEPKPTEKEGPR